jgi:hypothetical protein
LERRYRLKLLTCSEFSAKLRCHSVIDYGVCHLGADFHFDPLVSSYLEKVAALKIADPPVSSIPMQPENMPGYRKPRKSSSSTTAPAAYAWSDNVDTSAQSIFTAIFVDDSRGHSEMLSHVPVCFGTYEPTVDLAAVYKSSPLYNSDLVCAAQTILEFHWAVYSFNSGHFLTSIDRGPLPFRVTLAADRTIAGRSCFKEFTGCQRILDGRQNY